MPAWKKHEAGRRGRDAYESDDFYEAAGREPARDRIERRAQADGERAERERAPHASLR